MAHGAIEDRYGHDTIVEAARLLRDELPDLRVVFTGRGSNEDELRRLIESSGMGDIVRFEGFVSRERLNDLLHTADVGIVAQKASPYSHLITGWSLARIVADDRAGGTPKQGIFSVDPVPPIPADVTVPNDPSEVVIPTFSF